GFAVENPTDGVKLLAESTGSIRVVTVEEELAYLQAASQPLRDIGKAMLETGMRPEEVFRVEPAIIDFNRSTISIPFGKTKATRAVAAGVDLPTLAALLGHTKIQMTMRYVHPAEQQMREATGKLERFKRTSLRMLAVTESPQFPPQ